MGFRLFDLKGIYKRFKMLYKFIWVLEAKNRTKFVHVLAVGVSRVDAAASVAQSNVLAAAGSSEHAFV